MNPAFKAYLDERFPIGPYVVLIGAMVVAAGAAAAQAADAAVPLTWAQAVATVTLLLGFFHLRVFDEHKDYDRDLLAHPERVLSRGLITLADLKKAGAVAVVLQVLLNLVFGWQALLWVAAYVLFSVAMRYEFGVGRWLNEHLVLYAITHNPIVALMMIYATVVAAGTVAFPAEVVWWLLAATFTSLGFEIGRKLRAPQDERAGQDTYTAALGIPRAVALLIIVEVCAVAVSWPLLRSAWALAILAFVALVMAIGPLSFWKKPTAQNARLAENTSTLGALVVYIVIAVDIASRQGVVWT